jgi:hypothetical protein
VSEEELNAHERAIIDFIDWRGRVRGEGHVSPVVPGYVVVAFSGFSRYLAYGPGGGEEEWIRPPGVSALSALRLQELLDSLTDRGYLVRRGRRVAWATPGLVEDIEEDQRRMQQKREEQLSASEDIERILTRHGIPCEVDCPDNGGSGLYVNDEDLPALRALLRRLDGCHPRPGVAQ